MGKVKQLWQDEREKRYNDFVQEWIEQGYRADDAHEFALEQMAEYDEANGQFGAGA